MLRERVLDRDVVELDDVPPFDIRHLDLAAEALALGQLIGQPEFGQLIVGDPAGKGLFLLQRHVADDLLSAPVHRQERHHDDGQRYEYLDERKPRLLLLSHRYPRP